MRDRRISILKEQLERIGFLVMIWKPDRHYRVLVAWKDRGQVSAWGSAGEIEAILAGVLLGYNAASEKGGEHA
jgi:hypothetical protein